MLYRIDCFEGLCQENNCWGKAREFNSGNAKMSYMQHDNPYLDYGPFEEPTCEVILLSGLSGAGKDTFVKKNSTGFGR